MGLPTELDDSAHLHTSTLPWASESTGRAEGGNPYNPKNRKVVAAGTTRRATWCRCTSA